jgi:hypothetical protein
MRKMTAGILLAAGLSSCGTPTQTYYEADWAIFQAVAPEYRRYIQSDPTLNAAQVQRRIDTITAWQQLIEAAAANDHAQLVAGTKAAAQAILDRENNR